MHGTRITVSVVLEMLAAGKSVQDVLTAYPELDAEDVQQAMRYAARVVSDQMTQSKKNTARWVLEGISGLGVVLGVGLFLVSIVTPLEMLNEDFVTLCFTLGFSAITLVVGAWLARDCYRMLRGRSFEGIKSISGLLAIMFFGSVAPWLEVLDNQFPGDRRVVGGLVVFLADIAILIAAVAVYSICMKLLNRLVKAARGPAEPAETPHPAG